MMSAGGTSTLWVQYMVL